MKNFINFVGAGFLILLIACTANKTPTVKTQMPEKPVSSSVVDRRVDSLLQLMTLQEKIGQLTLYTTDWESTGPTIRDGYKNDIRSGTCGALFNSHTARFTRELQRIAVEETRLKIPLLFGYDVIHGYKTIFPVPLGEAASWDLQAIELSARIAATEASAAGLHWTFAPMVDIARDPRWGRVMEGAGEDTYLGCKIAEARVRGFQGTQIGNTDAVVSCVKHFAAYGAPLGGRDYNTVELSENTLREFYLPPYKAAIDAGALTVMTSFNDVNSIPASGNRWLLTDLLRKEWGFTGFVVTDYTAINEMVQHRVLANEKEAGELALNAGVDMDMQGAVYQRFLEQSLKEGKVKMTDIDEAVRRILRIKFMLGLFENPYKFSDEAREARTVFSAAHRVAARDVARRSIVLLKNKNNVLPLQKNARIALIGPLADNKVDMIGPWSASGEGDKCVSLIEGIRAAAPKSSLIHVRGCEVEGTDRSGFEAAVTTARSADVVVVAVGERAAMSGEASSRTMIGLPGVQTELVQALAGTGKPVVVVLTNGRPLAIPEVADTATAILETWFLGTEAGNAIADVLFGDYNPSGKLTMSFPRHVGQVPVFYNEKSTGRPFDPVSKWTTKYLDMPNSPQFPFGFGLSYTTFRYSIPSVDKNVLRQGETVTITTTVTNTGSRPGEEVVQFYVRDLVASLTRPVKELKGFTKISLAAGESKTVQFTVKPQDLAFYRADMKYNAEPGEFDFIIGPNSSEGQSLRIRLE